VEEEVADEVLFEVGVAKPAPGFTLFRPIFRGNFNTSDNYSEERAMSDLLKIIEYILYQKLQIPIQSIEEYDLLFVLPDNFNRKQYENLFDLVFKSINCGGICLQLESVMCAFANCLASGLFLDIGYTKTTIVAVDEGIPIDETLTVLDFGIQNIVQIYERILATKRNIIAGEFEPPTVWESILPALGRFNYDVEEEDADKIILRKAKLLLKRVEDDEATEFMLNLDDTVVALNSMFLEIPELKLGPLDQAIVDSVFKVQSDELRKKLFLNIMLSGGFAGVEGLTSEVENRVIEKVPDDIEEVAVMEPQAEEINQTQAPFIGGTILPKLDSYSDVLVKRDVYMGTTQTAEKRTVVGKNYLKERLSFKW
jgi:actin-related protein